MADESAWDWSQLPPRVEEMSLWVSLHDSSLLGVEADWRVPNIRLEFDVHYLRKHHQLPDDLRFNFEFQGAQGVRVTSYVGDSSEKGAHWESVGWRDFLAAFAPDLEGEGKFDVYRASLAFLDGQVKMDLEGRLDGATFDEEYVEFQVFADSLQIAQSDGKTLSVEQFRQMGAHYWDLGGAK